MCGAGYTLGRLCLELGTLWVDCVWGISGMMFSPDSPRLGWGRARTIRPGAGRGHRDIIGISDIFDISDITDINEIFYISDITDIFDIFDIFDISDTNGITGVLVYIKVKNLHNIPSLLSQSFKKRGTQGHTSPQNRLTCFIFASF